VETESIVPRLDLAETGVERSEGVEAEHRWQITNRGVTKVTVLDSWLPHGGFRADRRDFAPPLAIEPGVSAAFSRRVRCPARPGEVVENAFLIANLRAGAVAWRAFFRLRIERRAGGELTVEVERTTIQPAHDASDAPPSISSFDVRAGGG
jgi:hypothetical protein